MCVEDALHAKRDVVPTNDSQMEIMKTIAI